MQSVMYVDDQNMSSPPCVPDYWVYSNDTFEGPDVAALCEDIFGKMTLRGVCIERKRDWYWEAQYCDGPYYICFDIHVFNRGNAFIMDVNRLSGDRWSWWRLMQKIKGKKVPAILDREYRPLTMTHKAAKAALDAGNLALIGPDVVWIIGQNVTPESIVPFLQQDDLNMVRAAMLRLTYCNRRPDDCTSIERWMNVSDDVFLHREIKKHANIVLQKNSRL